MLKNITLMPKKVIELDKEKIIELYESGNTTEQISKLFSVTPPTIRRFMKNTILKLGNLKIY